MPERMPSRRAVPFATVVTVRVTGPVTVTVTPCTGVPLSSVIDTVTVLARGPDGCAGRGAGAGGGAGCCATASTLGDEKKDCETRPHTRCHTTSGRKRYLRI